MGSGESAIVLFTDLVGSTDLSSRLHPDAADELRHRHFSVLRRVISDSDGREVKNLGDGLMVVFASASAALICAVGMQQAIDVDNVPSWQSCTGIPTRPRPMRVQRSTSGLNAVSVARFRRPAHHRPLAAGTP